MVFLPQKMAPKRERITPKLNLTSVHHIRFKFIFVLLQSSLKLVGSVGESIQALTPGFVLLL
jgi:hypothetical protein